MKSNEKKSEQGYFTVEAVFIVVSMLIIIFAIVYGFMLIYQYAVLYNAAALGANEAVLQYENDKDLNTIITSAESVAKEEAKRGLLSSDYRTEIEAKLESTGLLGHKVVVSVTQRFMPKMQELLPFFDPDKLCITATVENKLSGIKSAQDMINGVDFGLEILNRIEKTGEELFGVILQFLIL